MKKLQFKTNIHAPIAKVYNTMLGLDDKATYEAWVAEFNPTSTFEGSWEKGTKILFIGTGEDGEKGGMVCEIAENIPNKFVSIRSYGILKGETEITEGEEIEKWTGGLENYTFEENNGITTVTVDIDMADDYVDYFNETYPKALSKLKSILES
ncbi:MAG TPA: SRPBCC domain-containing protein [Niabella sp.]|nr:SRPBCC domain-containing protein [Niabella sp.]